MTRKQKKTLKRLIISLALTLVLVIAGKLLSNGSIAAALSPLAARLILGALYLIPYFIIGWDILKKAARGILNGQVFDENFLMAIATVGAFVLAFIDTGDFTEAVAVMIFYQTGEFFQSVAVGKSRKNITELMNLRPDSASVEESGEIIEKSPDEVPTGSIIVVRPGQKVPIDGIIIEGASALDTSALTGESMPRSVTEGDEVLSGCINKSSLLRIRTTKPFGESAVSKIMELVENASSKKSKSENFITKFARVYTPAVCAAALAIAVIPPLVNIISNSIGAAVAGETATVGSVFLTWLYRALSFLVISCPCALVISIPLSFFAGLGGASKNGVLVKGSSYFEKLAQVKTVVFDKTGTLTEGSLGGVELAPATAPDAPATAPDAPASRVLYYAAHAEAYSTHPLGRLIKAAYGAAVDTSIVTDVTEYAGAGLAASVGGRRVIVGSRKLLEQFGYAIPQPATSPQEGGVVYVAFDDRYAGKILLYDRIKETSCEAIRSLRSLGVENCVMLTGDKQEAAEQIAAQLGIDTVYAELLPEDKVERVEDLLDRSAARNNRSNNSHRHATLAFVGDGINDAPVLMRADIGIAMGGIGSDAAIEAADVVLMDDDPMKVALAIRMARKCMRIVYENIYFAIGVKLLCLLLSAVGLATMWLAIFADVGVMVIAVLNAIRALRAPKIK